MEGLLDFIAAILLEIFGEAAFKALVFALPSLVWGAGAYCFVFVTMHMQEAWPAALVAFLCGVGLTVAWAQGVKWARNILFAGLFFSIGDLALLLAQLRAV